MHARLLLLSGAYLLANLLNNVAVQQMGYYMPIYSAFLLYGTTFLYTIVFAVLAALRGELSRKSWQAISRNKKHVLILGVCTAFNGIFAQISIPFVSPELTAIITNVSTPVTWLVYPFLVRSQESRPTVAKMAAFIVILGGLLFGSTYSYVHGAGNEEHYKNGRWVIVALLSAIPTSFETVFQEKAYREQRMPVYLTLTLYNLVSFLPYFVWMFTALSGTFGTCVYSGGDMPFDSCANNVTACSTHGMWEQQKQSMQCFFGDYTVPCCAGTLSTVWVALFTVGYVSSFSVGAYVLLLPDGANLLANLNALSSPFVGFFFWIPKISGPAHSHFEWWLLVSFIVILLGNLIYDNLGNSQAPWNHRFLSSLDGSTKTGDENNFCDEDNVNPDEEQVLIN